MVLIKRTVIFLWASSLLPATSALPLLTTIGQQPDLSIFSAVINGTGGKLGIATPALWERFNEVRDKRDYTAFVPTDSAFSKIATPVVDLLGTPRSYELLLSIIRTHIAEGLFTTTAEITAQPIRSIEGFTLNFTSLDDTTVTLNNQTILEATSIAADNGVVHKIDQVLNPYTAYFGISNSTSTVQSPDKNRTTIADIVTARLELSTLSSIISNIDPQFLTQLASTPPLDSQPNVLFAPSNTAFAQFPSGGLETLQAPFNQPLSSYLIRYHLANGFVSGSGSSLEAGKSVDLPSSSGFNITTTLEAAVDGDMMRAFIRVDNAVVEEAYICADNGCVFIIDRFLDPLYFAFGGSL